MFPRHFCHCGEAVVLNIRVFLVAKARTSKIGKPLWDATSVYEEESSKWRKY